MQKILVIDDDREFRATLAAALRQAGFETIEAENGRAGVRLATTYLPDLILSDIQMDGFDGFAALAAIRYHHLTSTIPFILMTGKVDEQGRHFAMELGADEYLAKPFAIADLMATMNVAFKKHETMRAQTSGLVLDKVMKAAEAIELDEDTAEGAARSSEHAVSEAIRSRASERQNEWGSVLTLATARDNKADPRRSSGPFQNVESVVEAYLRMLNRFHPNLGNTAMRAVALTINLAGVLGLPVDETRDLCLAAALHDISLVGLEQEAVGRWLRDPRKVTEEEWAFIQAHPVESQQMLAELPIFQAAGQIICSHHESWNGSGYPDGLVGEQIPWLARLLSVTIGYCGQLTLGAPAIKTIEANSGKSFDPRAIEAVVKSLPTARIPKGLREILLHEMKPGQVVAGDILNITGALLVRKGRILGDRLIGKLHSINQVTALDQHVYVYC